MGGALLNIYFYFSWKITINRHYYKTANICFSKCDVITFLVIICDILFVKFVTKSDINKFYDNLYDVQHNHVDQNSEPMMFHRGRGVTRLHFNFPLKVDFRAILISIESVNN